MTRERSTMAVAWALVTLLTAGCSDPGATPAADSRGADLVGSQGCERCHGGASLAGSDTAVTGSMSYGPNLTPDMNTGLGGWSEAQIIAAIRTGVDDEGQPLCPEMPRYATMSDDDVNALVAYLRQLAPIDHAAPASMCAAPLEDGGADVTPEVDAVVSDVASPDVAVPDVTIDTGFDTGFDAGFDGGLDAGLDAGRDAGRDASMDARADARIDAAADARADAVADARADARADVQADVPPVDAGPIGCHPVINEVLTGVMGAGTHEWVELYNPCTAAINLTGWRVGYRSAANTAAIGAADTQTLFTFATQSIAPRAYLVLAGAGYTGTVDGRLASGMADPGGGVGLRNAAGVVVDSMGWGTAVNAFVRVRVAAVATLAAAPGRSLQRLPDGADTGNTMADFRQATTPTPRAANR